MNNFNIQALVRPNIARLKPYSSARSLYKSGILMDANENPYNLFGGDTELNRYPDSSNEALRSKLAALRGLKTEQCAVGNGSDELIDLLFRIFCEPGKDSILITSPTYGMYEVAANINDISIIDVPLADTQLDVEAIQKAITAHTKIIFLCSPNNPTGDILKSADILKLAAESNCIVLVDEAYADFVEGDALSEKLGEYPNLLFLRTLSKAFGLAGARLGYLLAHPQVIELVQKVKPPYNISQLTTVAVLKALNKEPEVQQLVLNIITERKRISEALENIGTVRKVYSSQSNFILFKIDQADEVFKKLVDKGIIIRSRTNMHGLQDCLRLSIGTPAQNNLFLQALSNIVQ